MDFGLRQSVGARLTASQCFVLRLPAGAAPIEHSYATVSILMGSLYYSGGGLSGPWPAWQSRAPYNRARQSSARHKPPEHGLYLDLALERALFAILKTWGRKVFPRFENSPEGTKVPDRGAGRLSDGKPGYPL